MKHIMSICIILTTLVMVSCSSGKATSGNVWQSWVSIQRFIASDSESGSSPVAGKQATLRAFILTLASPKKIRWEFDAAIDPIITEHGQDSLVQTEVLLPASEEGYNVRCTMYVIYNDEEIHSASNDFFVIGTGEILNAE
ncbi:hypothetical protein KDL29_01100 [bacterium]|nr:hypothetical protein [bacterium]